MDKKDPEKKERMLWALEQGMVMIHLDARCPGVLVPATVKSEPHLRLNVSYRFDPPDLTVGDWGIRTTLSFAGNRFRVAVPWSALFAITSYTTKEFWMYADDMPRELVQQRLQVRRKGLIPSDGAAKSAVELQEVVNEAGNESPREEHGEPAGRSARRHLRVIK